MGKYIKDVNNAQSNNTSATGVQKVTATSKMIAEVKSKVTIPMYFYNVIVPQLGSYYDDYPVDFDNRIVVCCPLHDEDTPSCRYYEHSNSFYCFGCQKGGDVVALHRYFTEKQVGTRPTYEEAIAYLYNYFVKGKETTTVITSSTDKTERLNTDLDIVKLNLYRVNLEDSITHDRNITLEAKMKIWSTLDVIDCLLTKDLIFAHDAIDYIKKVVRETVTADSTVPEVKKITYGKSDVSH